MVMPSPRPSLAAALAAHWAAADRRSWATVAVLQLLGLWLRRRVLPPAGLLAGAALVPAELLAMVASLRWPQLYTRRLRLPLAIAIRATITVLLPWTLDALAFVQPTGQCSGAAGADPCSSTTPTALLPSAVLLLLPVAWLVSWQFQAMLGWTVKLDAPDGSVPACIAVLITLPAALPLAARLSGGRRGMAAAAGCTPGAAGGRGGIPHAPRTQRHVCL